VQSREDGTHHTFDLAQHLIIPEAENAITARFQISSSLGIRCDLRGLRVAAAVNLNDQLMLVRGKIGKVSADRRLATKVPAPQRKPTQMPP
jgi:hypothetical protein